MPVAVTVEEARLRRQELQERVMQDARSRLYQSFFFSLLGSAVALPLVRARTMTECIPEYHLLKKPISFKNGWGASYHIYKNEGLRRFWRGIVPMTTFLIPTIFTRQAATLSLAQDVQNQPSVAGSIGCGYMVTGLTSFIGVLANVFHLAYTKMATDLRYPEVIESSFSKAVEGPTEKSIPQKKVVTFTPYQNRNVVYTIKRLYTLNGAKSLFTGSTPYILGNFVHFSLIFAFAGLTHFLGLDQVTPLIATIASSSLAAVAVQPFDVVRTRMQFRVPMQLDYRLKPYNGPVDCAKHIWTQEGMKGFFRGSGNSVNIFISGLITSAIATTIMNRWKREKLRMEYVTKVKQYTADEREKVLENEKRQLAMKRGDIRD